MGPYTLEETSDYIIVRDGADYPIFRHNSGDTQEALADLKGIVEAMGKKLSVPRESKPKDAPPADGAGTGDGASE